MTHLPGVWRRTSPIHPDDRGAFMEVWRQSWIDGLPGDVPLMRQANVSRSHAGVLRGMHVHQRQADLWTVIEGRAFVALVDLRPIYGRDDVPGVATLEAGAGDALYLPVGVAHGLYAREPLTLLYLVTSEYDGSDELGFAWDDPWVTLPWPDTTPILSPRDASAPSLRELLARRSASQQMDSR